MATRYMSTSGNDVNAGTAEAPWATFSKALSVLSPGDLLLLKNGTYNQSLSLSSAKCGTAAAYISIKAEADGGATVIGAPACNIAAAHHFNIEGLIFRGTASGKKNVYVYDGSSYINFRRCSSYNKVGENAGAGFGMYQASYILLEDCAAKGLTRAMYNFYDCHHVTLRRCWAKYMGSADNPPYVCIQCYGSDYCIIENNIVTVGPSPGHEVQGISVWANTPNTHCDYNKVLGNVAYNMTFWGLTCTSALYNIVGNEFHNNAVIDCTYGFVQRADSGMLVNRQTIVGAKTASGWGAFHMSPDGAVKEAGFAIRGTVKNSSFVNNAGFGMANRLEDNARIAAGVLVHSYNNLNQNAQGAYSYYRTAALVAGTGEFAQNPGFNTTLYGKGAYLFRPTLLQGQGDDGGGVGADVMYRYVNGELTSIPLWPWPMEDRIFAETGDSVTWDGRNGRTGGLWKTLKDAGTTPPGSSPSASPSGAPSGSPSASASEPPPPSIIAHANYCTPWQDVTTIYTQASMNPALADLDKAFTYMKNLFVHFDGKLTFNDGVITASDIVRIAFNGSTGVAYENVIAAGSMELPDSSFCFVELTEANAIVPLQVVDIATLAELSNYVGAQKIVLAFRSGGRVYGVNMDNAFLGGSAEPLDGAEQEIVCAAEVTVNWNNGGSAHMTVDRDTAITLSNGINGKVYTLRLAQDAGGGRAITFATTIKWVDGSAPTFTECPGHSDYLTFIRSNGEWYGGFCTNFY